MKACCLYRASIIDDYLRLVTRSCHVGTRDVILETNSPLIILITRLSSSTIYGVKSTTFGVNNETDTVSVSLVQFQSGILVKTTFLFNYFRAFHSAKQVNRVHCIQTTLSVEFLLHFDASFVYKLLEMIHFRFTSVQRVVVHFSWIKFKFVDITPFL